MSRLDVVITTSTVTTDPDIAHRARLTVTAHATDLGDARDLLDMLGLGVDQ